MSDRIQIRGGTAAECATANEVLALNEMCIETDTRFLKLGDGATAYNDLPYFAGGDVDPADFTAVQSEVVTARGDRSSVDARIEAISRYSSPCAGSLVTGDVLDNSRISTAPTTVTGVTNRIRLMPFITSRPFVASAIGGRVISNSAGATRFLVYGSDANGWPGPKIFEGAEDLPSVAGPVFHGDLALPFDADRVYWLGVRYDGTATTLAAIQSYGVPNLGLIGGIAGTTYASMILRTLAFDTPAPDDWAFSTSERTTGSPPAIRLQVA